MFGVVRALGGCEQIQGGSHQRADVIEGAWPRRTHEGFEFGERLFDRIEVWAVGRQEPQLGPDVFDRRTHRGLFVDGEVVEHHHVARPQRGHQDLFDIGEERRVVDRPIEDRRRAESVQPQGGDHRMGLPMAARRVIVEPFAPRTAPVPAQQIGGHSTLVEEHVLAHIVERLPRSPRPTRRHDVRASLFVGVDRFF